MRKSILAAAAAALIIVGTVGGVLIAQAQPAPPPPAMGDGPMRHPGWMGWMRHGPEGPEGRMHHMMRTFALIYTQQDRKLTPPDVQKIAEAFLLWHGNHTWKVVNVAPAADGSIGFSLATQEGSVIASFTMDPHSGRVDRTG